MLDVIKENFKVTQTIHFKKIKIFFIGKGECVTRGQDDCDDQTAECVCNKPSDEDNSVYTGTKCQCCESGDCKEQCFDRFSINEKGKRIRGECFERGNCNCELTDESKESGSICKVIQ